MSKSAPGNPSALLDHIIDQNSLKNDAALSRYLGIAPPVVSKMRHGTLSFGAVHIIRLHELTGWSIAQIKAYLPQAQKVAA